MQAPDPETRKSIQQIVGYNWADEARDYDEQDAEGQTGHIFEHLRRVSAWLDATDADDQED